MSPLAVDVLLPCGTESARRRHLARAEVCADCRVSVGPPPRWLDGVCQDRCPCDEPA